MKLTPDEWKRRCAARYVELSQCDTDVAAQMAEACFEHAYEDEPTEPEYCADEDMSYWGEDVFIPW